MYLSKHPLTSNLLLRKIKICFSHQHICEAAAAEIDAATCDITPHYINPIPITNGEPMS